MVYNGCLSDTVTADIPMTGSSLEDAIRRAGGGRPDYLASLYKYARGLPKPATIVEIGCMFGESTIMMAYAMRGTNSHIITIDPAFLPEGAVFRDAHHSGELRQAVPIWHLLNNIAKQKLDGYITVIPDYSWNVLSRWDGREIDMLFVDGEHTYEAVKKDCEWMQYVRSSGLAVFDDWIEQVANAVKEYVGAHPEWHFLHENNVAPTDQYCITILQKD